MLVSKNIDKLSYFILFWLGLGNLLPFYSVITAAYYYSNRFCNTQYEQSFDSYFSFSYTLAQIFGLTFSLVVPASVIDLTNQVRWPLSIFAILFILVTITVAADIPPQSLFWVTNVFMFLTGFVGAVMNGGLFGIAGKLPPFYTSALMLGAGCAGMLVSASSFMAEVFATNGSSCIQSDDNDEVAATCDSTDVTPTVVYFSIATVVLFSCVYLYEILCKRLNAPSPDNNDDDANKTFTTVENALTAITHLKATDTNCTESNGLASQDIFESQDSNRLPSTASKRSTTSSLLSVKLRSPALIFSILKRIAIPSFGVFSTYALSLSIFPAVLANIQPQNPCTSSHALQLFNNLWVPILFLLWNSFDFFGRIAAERIPIEFRIVSKENVHYFAMSRSIFVILMMLCNVKDSSSPKLLSNDCFPVIIIVLMAFSNGYLANLAMMFGPAMIEDKVEASIAGIIMVFLLTLGLLCGSLLSFLLLYILYGKL